MTPCPCCGQPTIREPGAWEVCEVCGWEDDPACRAEPDDWPQCNGVTLTEARAAWVARAALDNTRASMVN